MQFPRWDELGSPEKRAERAEARIAELEAEVAKLRKLLLDIRGEDVMCDICGGSLDNGCYLMGSSIVAPKCCSVECAEKAIKEGRA